MKPKKIFKKMVKEHENENIVTYVSHYDNIRQVLKMLVTLPDTIIESVKIEPPESDGYEGAFLLTFDTDGAIWTQKAYFEDGRIARGNGVYLIDVTSIGVHKPEEFLIDGESDNKIKIIGGELDD